MVLTTTEKCQSSDLSGNLRKRQLQPVNHLSGKTTRQGISLTMAIVCYINKTVFRIINNCLFIEFTQPIFFSVLGTPKCTTQICGAGSVRHCHDHSSRGCWIEPGNQIHFFINVLSLIPFVAYYNYFSFETS